MNRYMRLIVMFDLPTISEHDRKIYAKFRNYLLDDGFIMMQFSIYSRICKNQDDANKHLNRISLHSPEKGNVRVLQITEKQYENMRIFSGTMDPNEKINSTPLIVIE